MTTVVRAQSRRPLNPSLLTAHRGRLRSPTATTTVSGTRLRHTRFEYYTRNTTETATVTRQSHVTNSLHSIRCDHVIQIASN
jgi:hypothetical protein